MDPTRDEWQALCDAAIRFKEIAPWNWMEDTDLFGVQNPENDQIGYCSVMGMLGEHLALGVFRGEKGLDGYWKLHRMSESVAPSAVDVLAIEDMLMASFEDRELLRAADKDVIKALGLKFRGRQAWPLFRSYLPNYEPWFLTGDEARFLTVSLEQAMDVAVRFREKRNILPNTSRAYLVRVPKTTAGELYWTDKVKKPKPFSQTSIAPAPLQEARIERLRNLPRAVNGLLEMDYFTSPMAVQDRPGERPYLPNVVMAADRRTGMVMAVEIVKSEEVSAALPGKLLEISQATGTLPTTVFVQKSEAYAYLEPTTKRLGIDLSAARKLPAISLARESLMGFLAR